jgi:pimeloyl-ACP methyl ester carboxylesterase
MNTASPGQAGASTAAPVVEAGFISSPGSRPRFGWLHRAAAPVSGVGLVIVPPFGYEAVCTQRSLRHLAEAAVRAGIVAMRVDLDGSGNSAGDDLDPDRLDSWLASIDEACALVLGAGADRLVLVGVRLGATLATLAAPRRSDVVGVVAIAALPVGKALLREGRILQMALGLAPAPASSIESDGVQELVGFALTAQTRDALGAIDLLKLAPAPAPAMLLLDRDDLPANDAWAAHLVSLGVEVDQRRLPGYVEMMLDPHRALIPQPIIDATIGFASARPAFDRHTALGDVPALVRRAEWRHAEIPVVEEVLALDDQLFAVATYPAGVPRRAVILLNAGAVGHIGPNRLHVPLARRLAAAGDLVVRLDISGIGDARQRSGADENIVYSGNALADVGIVVDWARRAGAPQIAVVGLCSGAYHALQAALAGQPIDTVVAINPLTFHYKPGMPLDFAAFRVTADAMRYQKSVASAASWRKLLRGQVNLVHVAKVLLYRARDAAARPLRDVLRCLRIPFGDDLGGELDALARRDVALRFIFAGDDPGQKLLAEQGGSVVPRLVSSGRLRIQVIPGADHTFTARWTHPILLDAISEALER